MEPVESIRKAQSAMEYLMTYGWALLIITIAMGVLFYLDFFNGVATVQSTCISSTGYLCTGLTINSTGYAIVTLGQTGGYPITVTGIACTNSTTPPSTFVSISGATLQDTGTSKFVFQCPGAAGPIGKAYRGYLWMVYDTESQSDLVVRIATFSAQVVTNAGMGTGFGSNT